MRFFGGSGNDSTSSRRTSFFGRDHDYRRLCRNLESQLREKEQEVDSHKHQVRALQKKVDEIHDGKRALEVQYGELQTQVQWLEKRVGDMDREARAAKSTQAELERAMSQMQTERRNLKTLLDTRTAELKEAQTYLSKEDDVTDSEVLRLVQAINSQIFQMSAQISDDFQASYGTHKSRELAERIASQLEKHPYVVPGLLHVLSTTYHRDDPILVQLALQTVLTAILCDIASPWAAVSTQHDTLLRSIYVEMCKNESQSVFGKWRTMALTYFRALVPDQGEVTSKVVNRLVKFIGAILIVCGAGDSIEDVRQLIKQQYGQALEELATHVIDFRRTVGERVVSRDLHVMTVPPSTLFSSSSMEDEYADAKNPSPDGPTFCTSSLGLIRKEQKPSDPGAHIDGDEHHRQVTLLKPKVILWRTVEGLRAECKVPMAETTAGNDRMPSSA
ncbi:hypothetical protein C8Q78DRAFT_1081496 [Trametes maxima]|nr:hypothetical protein C8Q78DRAFT_1081496 [Trametes maxima]